MIPMFDNIADFTAGRLVWWMKWLAPTFGFGLIVSALLAPVLTLLLGSGPGETIAFAVGMSLIAMRFAHDIGHMAGVEAGEIRAVESERQVRENLRETRAALGLAKRAGL